MPIKKLQKAVGSLTKLQNATAAVKKEIEDKKAKTVEEQKEG